MDVSLSILGTGAALPANRFLSDALDAKLGQPAGTLREATGVTARYYCDEESQIELAVEAVRKAAEAAKLDLGECDLVLSGSAIPYQTLPATAPLVMRELGIGDGQAAAFDVNSTCLSFVSALDVAARMIGSGQAKTAVVFASEIASRALPWDTAPETAALFGDGAAAAIVTGGTGATGLVASHMRTYPSAYEACSLGAGGTRIDYHNAPEAFAAEAWFQMDGRELFRLTSKHFRRFVGALLDKAGWGVGDIDLIIPHQASPFALQHMTRIVGVDPDRVVDIAADFGNQIAASIPFVLDHARRAGRVAEGSKVLILGTSAGVSFGGMAWVM